MDSCVPSTTTARRISRWLAIVLCTGLAAVSSYGAYKFRPSPTDQQIAKATDEVYEAVIHDMLPKQSELVFDDRLTLGDFPGGLGDVKSCQAESTKWVQVTDEPPVFDTTKDGMYRLLTGPAYGTTPRPEVVESYLRVRCLGGRLSRTFRTDSKKSFLGDATFGSSNLLGRFAVDSEFARLFPGASGIVGLSRVGFDREISEAIVSTSYVCGGLCGGGHLYFLKKVGGVWQVVSKRATWVS